MTRQKAVTKRVSELVHDAIARLPGAVAVLVSWP